MNENGLRCTDPPDDESEVMIAVLISELVFLTRLMKKKEYDGWQGPQQFNSIQFKPV